MRPTAVTQDPLRYPLNDLLGREANIRILRSLAYLGEPSGAADLAEVTQLSPYGTRAALERLTMSGFVVTYGTGRQRQYALRSSDCLIELMTRLFEAERLRYEDLMQRLRQISESLTPPPYSVWMRRSGEKAYSFDVGFLGDPRALSSQKEAFRQSLYTVEEDFGLIAELQAYTKADAADMDVGDHTLVYGVPVSHPWRSSNVDSHVDVDARARTWSESIVRLIRNDPSLIPRAKSHIERMLRQDPGRAKADLLEWRNILGSYSKRQLSEFLRSQSPRATRLRQSNPFFAVLTPSERRQLFDRLTDRHR